MADEDTAVNKYMETPPDMTIGQYTENAGVCVSQGSWNGGQELRRQAVG